MINPLWPLIVFSFGLPFIVLFWVLISKRKNRDKPIDLKEIINKEKQIQNIMRYK
jgi:hypothetical protein